MNPRRKKAGPASVMTAAVFLMGLCLFAYPFFSDVVYDHIQARSISSYTAAVGQYGEEEYERMLEEARQFNDELKTQPFSMELGPDREPRYESVLDPVGNGVMGYIVIPCIRVSLPVYHGLSDGALGAGAGHVPGSSLPVGGSGTHCLIAGHTGLSSSQLFTGLDRMKEGDVFTVTVLNRNLHYRVFDVRVVLPEETRSLRPVEGEDLCTLITCTPYGVNSHRLLVTGRRFEPENAEEELQNDVPDMARIIAAFAVALLLLLLFGTLVCGKNQKTELHEQLTQTEAAEQEIMNN